MATKAWLDMAGRVCVVTGAAGGIGAALVEAFAGLGATIVMLDRDSRQSARLAKEIETGGGQCLAIDCDVTSADAVRRSAEQVAREMGGCDILVNNAAVLRPGSLHDMSTEAWHQTVSVNLHGYFNVAQAFGRHMIEKTSGAIVHVGSISGSEPQANSGAYSTTKAAIAMMSRQLAFEWGPFNVRSNVVSPGLVRTPLSEAFYSDEGTRRRREAVVPMRRIATPQDIADVAVYLASDRARYVTGQEVVVDGGFSQTLMSHVPRPGYD